MQSSCKFTACLVWALVVGASVTAQLCCNVVLNQRSSQPSEHSFYLATIGVALGGVWVMPRSVTAPTPCQRPGRWWSLFGGIFTVTSFVAIPAGQALGVQVVLLVQLVALLGTALVFDLRRGAVKLNDLKRIGGFAVVLAGVALDNLGGMSGGGDVSPGLSAIYLAGTFFSGVGYAVQAKCNGRLARDLGSTARATAVSAMVYVIFGSPATMWLALHDHVKLVFHAPDWPLWLFCSFQSAFYIGSLAKLPKSLGYTTSYLTLLVGKLVSSSVVDAVGLTGKRVPFDALRAAALTLVMLGIALFSGVMSKRDTSTECVAQDDFMQEVASYHPEFVNPDNSDADRQSLREQITTSDGAGREISAA